MEFVFLDFRAFAEKLGLYPYSLAIFRIFNLVLSLISLLLFIAFETVDFEYPDK